MSHFPLRKACPKNFLQDLQRRGGYGDGCLAADPDGGWLHREECYPGGHSIQENLLIQ